MKISNKKKNSRTNFFLETAFLIATKALSKACNISTKSLLELSNAMKLSEVADYGIKGAEAGEKIRKILKKVNDRKKVTITQSETHIQANILNNKELLKELEKIEKRT